MFPKSSSNLLEPACMVADRYPHLDVTRICCICCVVIDNFNSRFLLWNTLYVCNWVLPMLWLVCGICFALSNRSLAEYECRLFVYFAIGATANWAAWIMNQWPWFKSPFVMTCQMMFVFWLMIFTAILAPLKHYLRRVHQQEYNTSDEEKPCSTRDDSMHVVARNIDGYRGLGLVFVGWLVIVITGEGVLRTWRTAGADLLMRYGTDILPALSQEDFALRYFNDGCRSLQACLCGLWIVGIVPKLFWDLSCMTWMLLANLYLHRVIYAYGFPDLPFHGFYLLLVALVAHEFGLALRAQIGKILQRYWMVVCFMLAFFSTPGLHGPLLEVPPPQEYVKERYMIIEPIIVVAWLTFGDRMVDPKIFTEDRLMWVNDWALISFLVHKAVFWAFNLPTGWVCILIVGPICWFCRRLER